MTNVHIIVDVLDESEEIIGVFSTKEKAKEFKQLGPDTWTIDGREIDEELKVCDEWLEKIRKEYGLYKVHIDIKTGMVKYIVRVPNSEIYEILQYGDLSENGVPVVGEMRYDPCPECGISIVRVKIPKDWKPEKIWTYVWAKDVSEIHESARERWEAYIAQNGVE